VSPYSGALYFDFAVIEKWKVVISIFVGRYGSIKRRQYITVALDIRDMLYGSPSWWLNGHFDFHACLDGRVKRTVWPALSSKYHWQRPIGNARNGSSVSAMGGKRSSNNVTICCHL
jgi:hypothetical protein